MRSDGKENKVTIDVVAARAGVSKTTVSRFLNGRFDKISKETREKIAKVVEELNYRPNRLAQSLKSRNTRTIGCLVSDIGSPFSSILVKGINSVLTEQGYQLLLIESEDDPAVERGAIDHFLQTQIDGLIVNSTGYNDEYLLELRDKGLPIVMADRALSIEGEIDTVTTNSEEMTASCLQYLRRMGYSKVGFFTNGLGKNSTRIRRLNTYLDCMDKTFGYDGHDTTFIYDPKGGQQACQDQVLRFLTTYPDENIALFAVNGVTMLDVLNSLQRLRIQPGESLGVCGFDNWGWADLIPPGITTITQDSFFIGVEAAKILISRIEGIGQEACRKIILPSRLEIRGSTAGNI